MSDTNERLIIVDCVINDIDTGRKTAGSMDFKLVVHTAEELVEGLLNAVDKIDETIRGEEYANHDEVAYHDVPLDPIPRKPGRGAVIALDGPEAEEFAALMDKFMSGGDKRDE